jgi:hypothetical protein
MTKLNRYLSIFALVVVSGTPLLNKPVTATEAALTAPASYDISFKHDVGYGEYILTGTDSYFGFPAFNREVNSTFFNYFWNSSTDLIDGDPINAILNQHEGLSIGMRFNRSNTSWSVGSGTFAGKYFHITEHIGSNSSVGTITTKVSLTINNQSQNDYRLYFDVSGTNTWSVYTYTINSINIGAYFNAIYLDPSSTMTSFYVPSFSTISLVSTNTSAQRYLTAFYLQNLGLSAAYDNGFQDGYNTGYPEGFDDGYNNSASPIWDGAELVVGIAINFVLFILTLSVFDISLLNIGIIFIGVLGLIWILKAMRG